MRRAVVLLVVLASVAACGAPAKQSEIRPNILLVLSDDERIDSKTATPHIYTWFSRAGTVFKHAYVTTPDCCPSRASIFTGQYVHNHRVIGPSKIPLLNMKHTMQYALERAGYETGYAGKFLNTWNIRKKPPYFEKWTVGDGYKDVPFSADGKIVKPAYGPNFVFEQGTKYIDDWEQTDSKPWFLEIAPSTPHEPFTPEAKYAHLRFPWFGLPSTKETDRGDKPRYVRRSSHSELFGASQREDQLRALRTLDDRFVELIDHLESMGELDRTLVIYLSDNGYLWGEHGLVGKAVPYLSAVRVPMYMRGPGVPTEANDDIVANIDVAPTIYAAARVRPRYFVDGRPLLSSHREELLLEFRGGKISPRWSSLVSKDWQYVEYADGFTEYYDLRTDPYQLENDTSAAPSDLATKLARARTCAGATTCP